MGGDGSTCIGSMIDEGALGTFGLVTPDAASNCFEFVIAEILAGFGCGLAVDMNFLTSTCGVGGASGTGILCAAGTGADADGSGS